MDGSYDRPVILACPLHQRSHALRGVLAFLNPNLWYTCTSPDHDGERRWTLCGGGPGAGPATGFDYGATHARLDLTGPIGLVA